MTNLYRETIAKIWLGFLVLLFVASCTPATDEGDKTKDILLQGRTMGTTYSIKLVSTDNQIKQFNLYSEVENLLVNINQQMSTYIPDSELSKFNQMRSTEAITVSSNLKKVIDEALRIGVLSHGRLDVTVGPLVNLWGFGPDKRVEKAPSQELIEATQQRIGIDKLFSQGNLVGKTQEDLYVDLSTIAKGFGVDEIAELLEERGITNYLVEIGGEMRVNGKKADGSDWRVAIEKPVTTERAVQQIVAPKQNAIATSGDYRNYFESDGQRFSHIINPVTGKPINHKLVSVTVIHPQCMTADGLSTAIMVMGVEEGMEFAERNNIAVYMISKSEDGFVEHVTPSFEQYIVQ